MERKNEKIKTQNVDVVFRLKGLLVEKPEGFDLIFDLNEKKVRINLE